MATNELGTRCAFILFDFFLVNCDSSSSTSLGSDSLSMFDVIADGEILLTCDTRMDFRYIASCLCALVLVWRGCVDSSG